MKNFIWNTILKDKRWKGAEKFCKPQIHLNKIAVPLRPSA